MNRYCRLCGKILVRRRIYLNELKTDFQWEDNQSFARRQFCDFYCQSKFKLGREVKKMEITRDYTQYKGSQLSKKAFLLVKRWASKKFKGEIETENYGTARWFNLGGKKILFKTGRKFGNNFRFFFPSTSEPGFYWLLCIGGKYSLYEVYWDKDKDTYLRLGSPREDSDANAKLQVNLKKSAIETKEAKPKETKFKRKRRSTKEDFDKIKQALGLGFNQKEVAEKFKCSLSLVNKFSFLDTWHDYCEYKKKYARRLLERRQAAEKEQGAEKAVETPAPTLSTTPITFTSKALVKEIKNLRKTQQQIVGVLVEIHTVLKLARDKGKIKLW